MHDPTTVCPKCQGEIRLNDLSCRACGHQIRTQPLLGEVLIDEKIVSRDQLEQALKLQQRKLGEVLVDIGACKPEDLDRAFHIQARGRTRAELAQADLKKARLAAGALALVCALLVINLFRSQAHAAQTLRLEREELSIPEVVAIMNDPSSPHKFDALRSLSRHIQEPAALDVITKALKQEKWYVKLYAAMLARESMNRATVPALIPLLPDPQVGLTAHQSLLAITGEKLERHPAPWTSWARAQGMKVDDVATGQ